MAATTRRAPGQSSRYSHRRATDTADWPVAGLIDAGGSTARAAGASDPAAIEATGSELLERWREPHRHYHTVAHLTAVLDVVDAHAHGRPRPTWSGSPPGATTRCTTRGPPATPTNATAPRSPRACSPALGVPRPRAAEVRRLVLLTAGHQVDPADADGALLCDADLAVLAARRGYDKYAARSAGSTRTCRSPLSGRAAPRC